MASDYLSIEAGDSVVKVCLVSSRGKGKSPRLNKAFMLRTPIGSVSDGVITDPSMLAEKLTERLQENGITGIKNVVFTLASGKVATREVTIPPVKENRIRPMLDANMTEYFPMDISKYQIDYGMVKQTEENGNKVIGLTLMAAPLSMVDSYVKFARSAGLTIDAIDYAGNSQFQMIKALGSKKVAIYINVDCQYSFVSIAQGDTLIFQRMLPYGGNEYIEAYRDASDGVNDYVECLKACCVPLSDMKSSGVLTDEQISESLSRITSGIERSMDFFNTLRINAPLEEVVLFGACAHLAGLREAVAEATNNTQVFYLEGIPSAETLGGDAPIIATFVSAYGAALKPIQLLPAQFDAAAAKKAEQEATGVERTSSLVIPVIVCVLAAIIGAGLVYYAWDENAKLTNQRDSLQTQIAETRYIENIEATYFSLYADARKFENIEKLVEANMNNKGLVNFFEELERKMPTGLSMMTAVCTNNNVTMSIRVPSLEAAAKVLVQFRTFSSLSSVSMSSITEDVNEAGFEIYAFTINCNYYIEPDDETEDVPPIGGALPG